MRKIISLFFILSIKKINKQKFNSNDNLSLLIEKSLSHHVNPNEVGKYFDILEENSFIFDQLNFQLNYLSYFYLNGNLVDVEIEESKMKIFLNENKENFLNVVIMLKKMISSN